MRPAIPLTFCSLITGLTGCAIEDDLAVSEVESLEIGLPLDLPPIGRTMKSIVDEAVGDPLSSSGRRRYVGLSVLVIKNGSRYTFNYGQAVHRSGGGPPVTADTLFAIGSVTKTFTATLLSRLNSEDRLFGDWDDEVSLYTSAVPAGDRADITLKDLALHLSGLVKNPPGGTNRYERGSYSADASALMDSLESCNPSCHAPIPYYEPDALYSNWGYAVLGFAIASAVGRTFPAALQTFVLTPLGMNSTRYKWQLAEPSCVASGTTCGYADYGNCSFTAACNFTFNTRASVGYGSATSNGIPLRGGDVTEYGTGSNDYIKAASGTLWSTPRDMMKWLSYVLDVNSGATGALHDIVPGLRMQRTWSEMALLGKYQETPGEGHRYLRKVGLIPGQFAMFMGLSNDGSTGIIVMSNYEPFDVTDLGTDLLDELLD